MNLKANLPKIAPVEPTEEMTRRIMGESELSRYPDSSAQPERHKDPSKSPPPQPAMSAERATGKTNAGQVARREGAILLNAKIPMSLHTRLKRTSQYNEISMTEILVRGIRSELESGRYSVPPNAWGTDD